MNRPATATTLSRGRTSDAQLARVHLVRQPSRIHTHTPALHSLPPCPHSHIIPCTFSYLLSLASSRATSEPSLLVLHGRPLHLESSGTCSPSSSCLVLQSAPSAQGAIPRARSWLPIAPTILLPRVLLSAERRFVCLPVCFTTNLCSLDLTFVRSRPSVPHSTLPRLAGQVPTDAPASKILDRGDLPFTQG